MKPWIVRLNDFASDEVPSVLSAGFRTCELQLADILDGADTTSVEFGSDVILRSERLSEAEYRAVYGFLARRGGRAINTPEDSQLLSNFDLHYPLIRQYSPKAVILPSSATPDELRQQLQVRNIQFPVFVKTELKSLKDESILRAPDLGAITSLVRKLHSAFDPFATFVVKEMVDLERFGSPPTPLEYRSFVLDEKVIHQEGDQRGKQLPDPSSNGANRFVSEVISALGSRGFPRHYIIDVAKVAGSNSFVVVEIKDAQFTKSKDYERYWRAMGSALS